MKTTARSYKFWKYIPQLHLYTVAPRFQAWNLRVCFKQQYAQFSIWRTYAGGKVCVFYLLTWQLYGMTQELGER
ncbi:MAG: hypothetical protein F6K25_10435 [Okeania sp. SIO2G4]|uniref:hypothetical protein n=1 Tax=unclassified Okeania TaxID=2634635 RepID=UPI0013BC43F0|nr:MULTISPECIES: hypothetical protein [unclassified Okeania]NEP06111.1 hypothetical protein [Okeania sp. SIO4D6]NEP41244.1 hypothetical protein [Okeania sp. SIO2H7]NEP72123.1 hypothetical protein [Okeania sp. SIO2G5]NEP92981.1 hypothetical protein [Okeania sp. SIO2F5]NEQ91101.1 hypothetical protein [Okeania sp. SIO2G4]